MSTSSRRVIVRFENAKTAMAMLEKLRPLVEPRGWFVVSAQEVVAFHCSSPDAPPLVDASLAQLFSDNDAVSVSDEEDGMLTLTATFRLPMGKPGEELGKQLHAFFDQAKTIPLLRDFKTAPFGTIDLAQGEAKEIACAHEGSLFELHLPATPSAIDTIKKFLMAKKVEQLKLKLCAYEELARLTKAAHPAPAKADGSASSSTSPAASSGLPTVGRRFLFTGKMASLVRDDAKKRVEWLGGISASSVSRELDYLVVGDDGSPLYGAGAKGSKILAAEKLQAHGVPVKIISEKQFLELKRR